MQTNLFEPKQVVEALRLIEDAGQVFEVRVLEGIIANSSWPATLSGYFNDPSKVVEALRPVRSATGIYVTVNPVNPSLLARANNRLKKAGKGDSTSDKDILSRRWLLIDADAVLPAGISASEEEHELAVQRARDVRAFLETVGWPQPILGDSGNGGHLVYRIDLPSDDDGLIERCLASLATKFADARVKLDTTVTNPARIWKLYGTLAAKGDNVPDRPHRLSRILERPADMLIVSKTLLDLLGNQPQVAKVDISGITGDSSEVMSFDVETFIKTHSIDADGPHDWDGKQGRGRRWILNRSPLCDHHDRAAFIVQHSSGAISAECHHDSCSWTWADLRKRLEPVSATSANKAKNGVSVTQTVASKRKRTFLEPYRPFPIEQLPSAMGDYVTEVSTAIGCDSSFVVLPVMACLARAIGNSCVVELKPGWTESATIWAAIVGKSGTHKTPAIKAATKFLSNRQEKELRRFEAAQKEYVQELAKYERDYGLWKRSKGDVPAPEMPPEPILKRFIVSDITMEAMADRMSKQYDGLLVVRDELAGWVNGIGEYKGGRGSDNGHWLATWSGAPMAVDRKTGDRKTIYIPRASVSLMGGIQPDILKKAMGREHMQDGMCARLLLAMPDARRVQWTEKTISFATSKILEEAFDRLIAIEPDVDDEGNQVPVIVRLTPEAKAVWIEYYNRHRDELIGMDDELCAAWTKLEAYTARFALIFHLCSWASGDEVSEFEIDEVSMRAAITVSDWFGHEARRVYAILIESEEARRERLLVELIRRKGSRVTGRDLKAASRQFESADEAEVALQELVVAGLGKWEPVLPGHKGGRATREFQLFEGVCVTETH